MTPCRYFAFAVMSVFLFASAQCRAEWGRYRAVTNYSFPSTPVYTPGVVVQSYRPVIVAPAPVVSGPIAITPPVIVSQPQAAYYAPAPVTNYYAPAQVAAPVTTYYAPAVVQPVVVASPTFRRAPAVFSFTPSRAAVAVPVIVP